MPLARGHPAGLLLCGAGAALLLGVVRAGLWLPAAMLDPLATWRGEVTLHAVVRDEPRPAGAATRFVADVDAARRDGRWEPARGAVQVVVRAGRAIEPGNRVELHGLLAEAQDQPGFPEAALLRRAGVHDVMTFPRLQVLQRAEPGGIGPLGQVRRWLGGNVERWLAEPHASLITGILLGNQAGLRPELRADLAASGTSHVVAVSGFNISVVAGLLQALSLAVVGRRRSWLPALAAVLLFTLLVGAPPSAVRAALMAGLALLASAVGRPSDPLSGLAAAAALMVGVDPSLLQDLGFQLSALATLGLVTLAPRLQRALARLPGWFAAALASSLAAAVFTLPLTLLRFQSLPLAALPANLVVVPVVPFAMALGAPLTLLGWSDLLGSLAAGPAWLGAELLLVPIHLAASLPGLLLRFGALPEPLVAGYYLGLALWLALTSTTARARLPRLAALLTPGRQAIVGLGSGLALLGILIWPASGDGLLHVVFLQASQAGAVFARSPTGVRVLIGGAGSGGSLAADVGGRLLFREQTLDLAVQTSPQADGQLAATLARYPARLLIAPVGQAPRAAETRPARPGQTVDLGGGAWLVVEQADEQGASVRLSLGRVDVLLPAGLEHDMPVLRAGRRLVLRLPRADATSWRATETVRAISPELVVTAASELPPGVRRTPVYAAGRAELELVTDGASIWLVEPRCPEANAPPGCSDE